MWCCFELTSLIKCLLIKYLLLHLRVQKKESNNFFIFIFYRRRLTNYKYIIIHINSLMKKEIFFSFQRKY